MKNQYFSTNSGQTKKLGRELAKEILGAKPKKLAFAIALEGELGSGKTTFLQGFAKGLGIREKILSPTFVILKKFQVFPHLAGSRCDGTSFPASGGIPLRRDKFKWFYHIDCYRIQGPKDLLDLGFGKIIQNPQNIVAIEWADRIKKIIPQNVFWLKFELVDKKTRKIIRSLLF